MLCVYMRPWTLNPEESSSTNPLLSLLGKCIVTSVADIPVWTRLRTSGTGTDDAGLMQGTGAALGVDANRVAHAMQGTTLHTGGDISVGGSTRQT